MIRQVYLIFFFLPCLLFGQSNIDDGIQWDKSANWSQVLAKAKTEDKYIFVDCYATWCGPCKKMDKDIYSLATVASVANSKFVCVRLQIDSSNRDDRFVRNWYPDAETLRKKYTVQAVPTFLFFSPEGALIHRDLGYKKEVDFLNVLNAASDTDRQFYTLVIKFREGRLSDGNLLALAREASAIGEKDLAKEVGHAYLTNYLYKQPVESLLTLDNVRIIADYVQGTGERGFELFYRYGDRIDSIYGKKGSAAFFVDKLVKRGLVSPAIAKAKMGSSTPDWKRLSRSIKLKFNAAIADRVIIDSKIEWYKYKKDWSQVARYTVIKVDRYGIDTAGLAKAFFNNMVWDVIFLHSNDPKVIKKGIEWMDVIVEADPNDAESIDTYANLLYKAGRRTEALKWEDKAMQLNARFSARAKVKPSDVYRQTLEKMKLGKPTWAEQ